MSAPLYRVEWPEWVLETDIASIVLMLMTMGESTNALTDSMNRVDNLLRSHPGDVGESREGSERVLFTDCLCVTYRIDEREKLVEVSKATYFQRKI